MYNPRFLVVSLGNPLPKFASLHSAGHFVLNGLPKILHQPSGMREATIGRQACMVSRGPKYTLVQCPTYMNTSGGFVQRAWLEMVKEHDPKDLSLILIHDELEREFGLVQLISWERSPRGHNGVKSVRNSFNASQFPESPMARITVGIGRPEARDSASVSSYVLAPINNVQRRHLEEKSPYEVQTCLASWEQKIGACA